MHFEEYRTIISHSLEMNWWICHLHVWSDNTVRVRFSTFSLYTKPPSGSRDLWTSPYSLLLLHFIWLTKIHLSLSTALLRLNKTFHLLKMTWPLQNFTRDRTQIRARSYKNLLASEYVRFQSDQTRARDLHASDADPLSVSQICVRIKFFSLRDSHQKKLRFDEICNRILKESDKNPDKVLKKIKLEIVSNSTLFLRILSDFSTFSDGFLGIRTRALRVTNFQNALLIS